MILTILLFSLMLPPLAVYANENAANTDNLVEVNDFGVPLDALPPASGLLDDRPGGLNLTYNNTIYFGDDVASSFDPSTGNTTTSEPNIAGDHVVTTTDGDGNVVSQQTQFPHIPSAMSTDGDGNVTSAHGQPSTPGPDSATSQHADGSTTTSTANADGSHTVTHTDSAGNTTTTNTPAGGGNVPFIQFTN